MIDQGIIKSGQVVFVYSQPPEEALIGYIDSVDYPFIYVRVIPRSGVKNKFGQKQKIDISQKIALTIMDLARIKGYMTTKEKKCLKKIREEDAVVDLFEGDY